MPVHANFLTPNDVKIRFKMSVLSTNKSGIKNTRSDINSIRLFCSGVPVSNRRLRACTNPIMCLQCIMFM